MEQKKEYLPIGNNILKSSSEKIILANDGLRVFEIGQNNEPIKESLKRIFALIGLKAEKYPSEYEKMILVHFIRENMNQYTPPDFIVAFEMAICGELGLDLNKLDHFQNFSTIYLAKVMNAYKSHKMKVIGELRRKEQEKKFAEKEISDDEKKQIEENFFKKMVLDELEIYKKTEELPSIMPFSAKHIYACMLNRGLIKYSQEEKIKIFEEEKSKFIISKMDKPIKLEDHLNQEDEKKIKIKFWTRVILDTFRLMKNETLTPN